MLLRRFTTYLLITSYISHTCLPTFAMDDMSSIEKQSENLKHSGVPARLDLVAKPDQTAAGSFIYAKDGDVVKVLLGLRDDEDTYCNPGGKSDKEDQFLHETGARETAEETLSIYCPHPDVLRMQPFVDLYQLKKNSTSQTPQPFLNRMYFIEQEYIEDIAFNERLANAQQLGLSKAAQEYRHFKWVILKDVLQALDQKSSTLTTSDTGEKISLYEPLFQTLLTDTSLNLLSHLALEGSIPSIAKKKRPVFKNKVHWEGSFAINHDVKVTWVLPEFDELRAKKLAEREIERKKKNLAKLVSPKDVVKQGKDTFEEIIFNPSEVDYIDFDQDAFGKKMGARALKKTTSKEETEHEHVPYDYMRNRKMLGVAVAAKANAILELKSIWQQPQNAQKKKNQFDALKTLDFNYFQANKADFNLKDSYHKILLEQTYAPVELNPVLELNSIVSGPNVDYSQPTLSDLLLQFQLGLDYVHPTNPYDLQSRHEADVKNLKLYHAKFGVECTRDLKRKVEPIPTDYEHLAQVMELVRQNAGWLPIHHASKAEAKYLWLASTSLYELLFLTPYPQDTLSVMRSTDLYFQGHPTMADSLRVTGTEDYSNGNMNRRLCGNMCVTSGLTTTYTSSNSVEYFCNSHSVEMPSIPKKYQEGVELLGMVGTSFLPYQSLFEQYYGAVNTKLPNSAWTIVFVNPAALDLYSHPSHGGGSIFYAENPLLKEHSNKTIPSTKALYERAEKELGMAVKMISPELSNPTTKRAESVAEVRALLHPDFMRDSSKTKVVSVDRFPLKKQKERKQRQLLRTYQMHDAGRWLSGHTKLIPGSIDLQGKKELEIKKHYALVHQGITGKPVEETLSLEAFKHLIKNGQVEGVQQFYEVFPDILQRVKYTPRELVSLAINSNSVETLIFLLGTILKTTVKQAFSKEDIVSIVLGCIAEHGFYPTHEYILQNFDLSTIDETTRREWVIRLLPIASTEAIERIHGSLLPVTLDVIEDAIKLSAKSPTHRPWKGIAKFKDVSKPHLAEVFLKHFPREINLHSYSLASVLLDLIKNGLSYSEPLPGSGMPLLFSLPYVLTFASGKDHQYALSTLAKDENLLDYEGFEGITLLPFIQRRLMSEGVPMIYDFKAHVLEVQIENRKKSSRPVKCFAPFQQEFGELSLFQLCSPFPCESKGFGEWRQALRFARESNSLLRVCDAWQAVPNPAYLDFYRATDPYLYLIDKLSALGLLGKYPTDTSVEFVAYTDLITKIIQSDTYSALFLVIDRACQEGHGHALFGPLGEIMGISKIQDSHKKLNIPSYSMVDLFKKPTEFEDALTANQIQQEEFVKAAYALRDEHVDLVKKVMPILFKNPTELVSVKDQYGLGVFQRALLNTPVNEKLLKCMLEYGGCFALLSQLTEEHFSTFIHVVSDDLLTWISTKSPEIFTFHDESRDFLKIAIQLKRFTNVPFFKANLKELKSRYNENGIPLVCCIDNLQDLPVLLQIIESDPSILKLKTQQGLSIIHLFMEFFPPDSDYYDTGKSFLSKFGIDLDKLNQM